MQRVHRARLPASGSRAGRRYDAHGAHSTHGDPGHVDPEASSYIVHCRRGLTTARVQGASCNFRASDLRGALAGTGRRPAESSTHPLPCKQMHHGVYVAGELAVVLFACCCLLGGAGAGVTRGTFPRHETPPIVPRGPTNNSDLKAGGPAYKHTYKTHVNKTAGALDCQATCDTDARCTHSRCESIGGTPCIVYHRPV